MSVSLRRKDIDLPAWHLVDQAAMLDALGYLMGQGWRGGLTANPGDGSWRLELNADNPTRQVIAETGDWIVLDMELRKLSAAECNANYEAAPQ